MYGWQIKDDQKDPCLLPTKDNIRMAMHWLVQGCSSGDSLVFHFSGMGAQPISTNNPVLNHQIQKISMQNKNGQCKGTSGGQAMLLSGFSGGKTQFSVAADSYASVGAMTHSFVKAVQCEPHGVTYGRLLTTMRNIMVNGGSTCNMPGPCGGAPISKIANFSGVQADASRRFGVTLLASSGVED
ncbi:hypothetical protein QOZ80_3BG0277550 [Eleusine coracana subsp. coracana]|nr:hypothetical protein QOZ80_3BG0277550 [Eleusine coracana subsp. coracana]